MKTSNKFQFIFLSIFTIAFSLLSANGYAQEYRYAMIDLGDLGGDASNVNGINDAGTVVGVGWFPGNERYHAVIFQDGQVIDLGTFGGLTSDAREINEKGEVVGFAKNPDDDSRAFLWKDGVMTDLGTLGGAASSARSINESGQIVGAANLSETEWHATLWEDGNVIDLGAFTGFSQARDINESSQIVGWSWIDTGAGATAVLWENGQMIDLGGLYPTGRSEARAINDLGQVVGWGKNDNFKGRALLWVNGKVISLQKGSSGINWSDARGINNVGQIVGFAQEFTGRHRDHGFIWEDGKGMQLLNKMVAPNSGLQIDLAYDINNHGEIAARAYRLGSGWFRALKLVPVTPELQLSDPVPGVAGEQNTWTITNAIPNSKVTLTYSLKGGGTVVPGCDRLAAVLQINRPKIIKTATVDANGEATFRIFVPAAAANLGPILLQAVSLGECQESQLSVYEF